VLHVGGKFISAGRMPGSGLAGLTVGAVGSSMVANAGRGARPLGEIVVPLGPVRLRLAQGASRKVGLRVDAYEALLIGRYFMVDGLAFDWRRSVESGTPVFGTRGKLILRHRELVSGVANGTAVVMSDMGGDTDRIIRHELIHVQQHSWAKTTLGIPAERWLRDESGWLRWIPEWLELGIADRLVYVVDDMLQNDNGPLYRVMQSEAEAFEKR
jgi:hypothetical protein